VPVGRVEDGRVVVPEPLAPEVEPPEAEPDVELLAGTPAPVAVEPATGPDGVA
jgi:hypothetical protein